MATGRYLHCAMGVNVLILCTGNSCRSQIAEGYLRKLVPEVTVFSAGIEAHGLNPNAVVVMQEAGIDIASQRSKTIEDLPLMAWDVVLTVCDSAREQCPVFPGRHLQLHHTFEDPALVIGSPEQVLQAFRAVRDAISTYLTELTEMDILTSKST